MQYDIRIPKHKCTCYSGIDISLLQYTILTSPITYAHLRDPEDEFEPLRKETWTTKQLLYQSPLWVATIDMI